MRKAVAGERGSTTLKFGTITLQSADVFTCSAVRTLEKLATFVNVTVLATPFDHVTLSNLRLRTSSKILQKSIVCFISFLIVDVVARECEDGWLIGATSVLSDGERVNGSDVTGEDVGLVAIFGVHLGRCDDFLGGDGFAVLSQWL